MLTSDQLTLRALEPTDLDLLYTWENDSTMWHLSNTLVPFSHFLLEQYIMNSNLDIFTTKQLRLMIDKNEDSKTKTIGTIDLFDFDPANKRAGIGILIASKEQRKGYASQALKMLLKYCFQVLHLHQVYCTISIDNKPSLKLFKNLNFEVCGIKKDWILIKGKWMDEYTLQLINPKSVELY